MGERCAIFIDGDCLERLVHQNTPMGKKSYIDFRALAEQLCGKDKLFRTYYYSAVLQKEQFDDEQEYYESSYRKKNQFLYAIKKNFPEMIMRMGYVDIVGKKEDGKLLLHQKCVDVALASDLVYLAVKGYITRAVLIAGDADFVPAVEIARGEGVNVQLATHDTYNNSVTSMALQSAVSEIIQLEWDFLRYPERLFTHG